MRMRQSLKPAVFVLLSVLVVSAGCSKTPSDAQVSSDIQGKFSADSGLQGKQLGVQADKGTITLSGVVDNPAQRDAAARYAASAVGVKQVVNNIQIADASPDQSMQAQTQPAPVSPPSKPSPGIQHKQQSVNSAPPSDSMQNTAANAQPPAPPENAAATSSSDTQSQAAVNQAPPPPPQPQTITVPSGTQLAVRLVDEINTSTSQQGELFHATLRSPVSVSGAVVIPAGYTVEGHIVAVQNGSKFSGQSLLTLQLDRITVGTQHYYLQTDQYHKETAARGKNTAEKVGGGAAIGAIIGGIFGGGKGAAIGAGAGGAAGTGVQAASKSPQIDLPAETLLHFTLQAPVTVTPTSQGPEGDRQKLESSNP